MVEKTIPAGGRPPTVPRRYGRVLERQLATERQMAFVTGPRQVGKTTTCRALAEPGAYLSWDDVAHRRVMLRGPEALADAVGLARLRAERPVVVLDEVHRFTRWRGLLKGFFDIHGDRARVVVTGSSRLDLYRRGADSLMGRYFLHRMHPLSVGELLRPDVPPAEIADPAPLAEREWTALWEHGGFPEPFVRRDRSFGVRWRELRRQQLLREDARDLGNIQDAARLEVLVELLVERSGAQIVYSSLARDIGASVDTVRRWVAALCALHFGFLVRPWFRNVAKSLRKEPKWYCTDWTLVDDPGRRLETFVACHLRKAADGWQDLGFGRFELRYLRDTAKREVDFVVVRDRRPWFLVEVKRSDTRLAPELAHFQRQTGAAHAFQAVERMDYVPASCFSRRDPCVVPLRTLLGQLL